MKATSFEVFSKHIDVTSNNVNVDRLFTQECVEEWVKTRKVPPKQPVESFRRTLTAHVKGEWAVFLKIGVPSSTNS